MDAAKKDAAIVDGLNVISTAIFGMSRSSAIATDTCIACKSSASEFANDASRREFALSGLCQKCQDEVFAEPED
jgi:hypothetical protein